MYVNAWLLSPRNAQGTKRCVMQELDYLKYAAQTMQKLDSMQCEGETTREGNGSEIKDLGHMSPRVTPDLFPFRTLLSPSTTSASTFLFSLSLFDQEPWM